MGGSPPTQYTEYTRSPREINKMGKVKEIKIKKKTTRKNWKKYINKEETDILAIVFGNSAWACICAEQARERESVNDAG